jgi:hypothetical protein
VKLVSDPFGEPAAPDVISSGGKHFGVFAVTRWPTVVKLAFAVAACGLGLAGIIAALPASPPTAPRAPDLPAPLPARESAGPGGVFASGVADGRAWRLAVQDVADPGYRCLPAITVDGTDADPVSPAAGSYADMAPGPAAPGIGFAFFQLPAGVQRIVLNGQESLPATTATGCGLRYRVVGFAYRLAHPPQITMVGRPRWPKLRPAADGASTNWPPGYQLLPSSEPVTHTISQGDGIWTNVGPAGAETAQGVVASGPAWSITVLLGAGGDCYDFAAPVSFGSPQMSACGPISAPGGPETIIALPLSYPPGADNAATGYAVQVSPATARLRATASDGSTQLVTPRVVDGRRYAAFVIRRSLRLTHLTWLDAAGREIASTTALPRYGYTQFQP